MNKLDNNIFVSGQITADDFPKLAEAGIKSIINNRPDGEECGQLSQNDAQELATQHGMSYHFLPLANGQPLPANLVDDFHEVISTTDEPTLIHCRSGMRSSIIWALGQVGHGNKSTDDVIACANDAKINLNNYRAMFDSFAENQ